MAIPDEQIKQIVELRMKGLSLRQIAKEAGVDRKTVQRYVSQYRAEIGAERYSQVQEVFEELKLGRINRLRQLAQQLENVESALVKADWSKVGAGELIKVQKNLLDQVRTEADNCKILIGKDSLAMGSEERQIPVYLGPDD